jgi:sulfatase maturation enzyme AslB (radical SAM superfamily)
MMTDTPSSTNKPQFSTTICSKILIELDGWQLTEESTDSILLDESVESDIFLDPEDPDELKNISTNKSVSVEEVERFYNTAFDEALTYTNRLDINDLDEVTTEIFMLGVYRLAASNLWNKYNVQINNDAMEGTYVVSQGGRLYKKACNLLDKFVRTNFVGLTSLMK